MLWQKSTGKKIYHAYDKPLHRDAAHELVSICGRDAIRFGQAIGGKPAKKERCLVCVSREKKLAQASGGVDLG